MCRGKGKGPMGPMAMPIGTPPPYPPPFCWLCMLAMARAWPMWAGTCTICTFTSTRGVSPLGPRGITG